MLALDEIAPRYGNAGASVGTCIALATASRVVASCSKLAFDDRRATTAGPHWVKTPAGALDHRRFWDAMDTWTPPRRAAPRRDRVWRDDWFGRVVEELVARYRG